MTRPRASMWQGEVEGQARVTSGVVPSYSTALGQMFRGKAEEVLHSPLFRQYEGTVQLVLTSPPFPLNRKKAYGNLQGEDYSNWLARFASVLKRFVKPDGSIVMEIGNAWERGRPAMSTLGLRSLLSFLDQGQFHLCEQFICYNPARLPSPAQWVTVERIRVKDSFTHIWWMAPTCRPKANNRNVLVTYSRAMQELLRSRKYNGGKRPSEHNVGESSFLVNNNGAIPPNVLCIPNTCASDDYQTFCRRNGLNTHPARMPVGVPEFFIKFLTDPGDIVLDPFAGSNTTGAVAEQLGRRWLSIELQERYIEGSRGWFGSESGGEPR